MYLLGGFSFADIGGDKTKPNLGSSDYWIVAIEDTTNNTASLKNSIAFNSIASKHFVVYPNPAKDVIHINTNEACTIAIINQQGKIMLMKQIDKQSDINISQLSAGIYFIKNLNTGEVQKLIINQ